MWPMILAQLAQGTQQALDNQTAANIQQRQAVQQQALGQQVGQDTPALNRFMSQNPSMSELASLFKRNREAKPDTQQLQAKTLAQGPQSSMYDQPGQMSSMNDPAAWTNYLR